MIGGLGHQHLVKFASQNFASQFVLLSWNGDLFVMVSLINDRSLFVLGSKQYHTKSPIMIPGIKFLLYQFRIEKEKCEKC